MRSKSSMYNPLFASRCGVILAVAGLTIAATAPSLANSPESMNGIERAERLAQNESIEEDTVESLPDAIAKAVLADVQERSGLKVDDLKIIKVAQQTWADGCLGLGIDEMCTQALVPGWQVIVASEKQLWAYRTDEAGSLVKWDEALSQQMTGRYSATLIEEQRLRTRTTETTEVVTDSRASQTQVSAGATGSQSRTTQTRVSTGTTNTQAVATGSSTQMRQTVQVSFTDIPANYWARDFIAELARLEIISGFPDGKFHPNEPVTRAQFAAMIRKAFEKSKIRNVSFQDVSTAHWAYNAIRETCEMGFLGVNAGNQFNPNQSLSRLQVLVALTQGLNYSYSGSTDSVLRFYSDTGTIPANVRTLVAAATQRGIVVNYPNVKALSPNQVATRAEVAAFLYQALVSTGQAVAISSPYVAAVEFEEMEGSEVREAGEVRELETGKPQRQNCNQGIGNGAEGCDPGNSRPHGGSNDEGGRTPGGRR